MAPEGVLSFEVEQIDVTMGMPYLDETWRFTDAAGHEHYYADRRYPTLRWIVDSSETYYCEDCREEHTDSLGHYECLLCGETIVPGITGPDTHRRYMPGRRAYFPDGVPISEERYEAIRAERQATA